MKTIAKIALAALCSGVAATSADVSNEQLFVVADKAMYAGRIADMQVAYEQILQSEPKNTRALNGKAAAQAWQRDYEAAQFTYSQALLIDNRNVESLVGLGYAYAWSGEFSRAHTAFNRALRVDPTNSSARKGIAYSYHWQGEHELALGSFETAGRIAPDDAEIEEAAGRVKLTLGHARDAVSHFDRALQLDPSRNSARLARQSAYTSAPALEVSTRVGSTSDAGSGLRGVELAHWPSAKTRFALRYDNTLGLDNPSVSDRESDAPGYFIAVQQELNERWILSVEAGRRNLAEGNQSVVTLQGSHRNRYGTVRLGTQLGRHAAGHVDKLLFGGFNFPLTERWRVEPVLYLSQTGIADDDEWRGIVNVELQSGALWKAGGFFGAGRIDATDARFSGSSTVAGLWGSYLLADRHSLQLSVRRDESPTANFTVAELGFTYRLAGN